MKLLISIIYLLVAIKGLSLQIYMYVAKSEIYFTFQKKKRSKLLQLTSWSMEACEYCKVLAHAACICKLGRTVPF